MSEQLTEENWKGTPPFDARFPNQNQTRNCYQNFVDYHRCHVKYGEDHAPCEYFKWAYKNLCPPQWYTKWDEQIEAGTFAGNLKG
ncbi:COX6B1 [Bugula neritina]|uniref:Cytochrome c oxidase subunit n=1 Tax=Bugula neritina TaxID=10212 RepID=A0A7J7JWX0_BUGNE|nr:COX6B1 [Bugula neritina]